MADLSENWPIDEEAATKMSNGFHSFDVTAKNFGAAVDRLTVFLDRKTGGWNNAGAANTQKSGTGKNQVH